jgi:hypothetical protein
MIQAPSQVTNKFDQGTSINIGLGATLDINCNTLVSFSDADFTGANYYTSTDGAQPFKLLFPLDSVVKPFRPEKFGIKYAIIGDLLTGTYNNPRSTVYKTKSLVTYRTYSPSKNTNYKYYVTQKNTNLDVSIRYYDGTSPISYENKAVPANKIVLKFELSHCTPSSWSIFINGTDVTSSMTKTIDSNGIVSIYYNGTSWTTTESSINYNSQVTVNSLRVTATNPGGNKYIGLIEVAPHWIKDLTDRIVSFGIQKEASSQANDILPIGLATANSLDMELNSYGNANILFRNYNFQESIAINNSYIYMSKKAEVKPFYKIYDAAGNFSDSNGTYFKVMQGSYYLDNWNIGENGELEFFALDAAKFLQETICPDIICDDYSAAAVIRRILDSVGFTNYNFNFADSDKSIISLRWWWSDGTKTVWSSIQELCSDTQMSAVFDENNVLQFYSRDFIFTKKASLTKDWTFRDTSSGNILPNIIDLKANNIASSNNVKVFYNSAYVAGYEQSNKSIVDVDKTSFSSASLAENLSSSTGAGGYMKLKVIYHPSRPEEIKTIEVFQSFSGYMLIDEEIIEYDAIEYEYEPIAGGSRVQIPVTGPADLVKYRGEAAVLGSLIGFIPTERYRIKARGKFGTKAADHLVQTGIPNGWTPFTDGVLNTSNVVLSDVGSGSRGPNNYREGLYAI